MVHSQDPRELVGGASDEMQSGSALLWAWKLRSVKIWKNRYKIL